MGVKIVDSDRSKFIRVAVKEKLERAGLLKPEAVR